MGDSSAAAAVQAVALDLVRKGRETIRYGLSDTSGWGIDKRLRKLWKRCPAGIAFLLPPGPRVSGSYFAALVGDADAAPAALERLRTALLSVEGQVRIYRTSGHFFATVRTTLHSFQVIVPFVVFGDIERVAQHSRTAVLGCGGIAVAPAGHPWCPIIYPDGFRDETAIGHCVSALGYPAIAEGTSETLEWFARTALLSEDLWPLTRPEHRYCPVGAEDPVAAPQSPSARSFDGISMRKLGAEAVLPSVRPWLALLHEVSPENRRAAHAQVRAALWRIWQAEAELGALSAVSFSAAPMPVARSAAETRAMLENWADTTWLSGAGKPGDLGERLDAWAAAEAEGDAADVAAGRAVAAASPG